MEDLSPKDILQKLSLTLQEQSEKISDEISSKQ